MGRSAFLAQGVRLWLLPKGFERPRPERWAFRAVSNDRSRDRNVQKPTSRALGANRYRKASSSEFAQLKITRQSPMSSSSSSPGAETTKPFGLAAMWMWLILMDRRMDS
jgi:hypothetical protein